MSRRPSNLSLRTKPVSNDFAGKFLSSIDNCNTTVAVTHIAFPGIILVELRLKRVD